MFLIIFENLFFIQNWTFWNWCHLPLKIFEKFFSFLSSFFKKKYQNKNNLKKNFFGKSWLNNSSN